MTCPFHDDGTSGDEGQRDDDGDDGSADRRDRGVDRRSFMQSALAIGGVGAFATVANRFGLSESAAAAAPTPDYGDRANRQHAWDAYEVYSEKKGTTLPPSRHVLLCLNYQSSGAPDPAERATVRRAFDQLESLFGWGSDGLLFTVGYSAAYFDRFDEDLPPGLDPDAGEKPGLLRSQDLIEASGVTLDKEDPTADAYDCVIHMASSDVTRLVAAEELLWGGELDVDDDGSTESLSDTLTGILGAPDGGGRPSTYPHRRVGFAGHDNLEAVGGEDDDSGVYPSAIPEDAKLSMGFNDLFKNSIPREDNATILEDQRLVDPKPPGAFAQGTIQHVSKLDLDLDPHDGWYQYDAEERVARMFSPDHDPDGAGEVGDEFGQSTAVTAESDDDGDGIPMRDLDGDRADVAERTEAHAEDVGVVGHAQKTARARFDLEARITEEGQVRLSGDSRDELLPAEERPDDLRGHDGPQEAEQVILRRDFDTVDKETPGLHFVALMRFNPYMAYMRRAMNGVDFDTSQFGLDPDGAGFEHEGSVAESDDGIVGFTETKRRGNYLVPPLTQRALPHPRAETVEISVKRAGGNYQVTVEGVAAEDLAEGSVRFGWYYDVNRARGAEPRQRTRRADRTTFVFPADETGIDTAPGGPDGDVRVRFAAQLADSGRRVRGTATLAPDQQSKNTGKAKGKGR